MTIYMNIPKKDIKEFREGLDYLTYLTGKEFSDPTKGHCNVAQFYSACNVLHRLRDAVEEDNRERFERYNKASKEYHDRLDELRRTDPVLSASFEAMKENDDGSKCCCQS